MNFFNLNPKSLVLGSLSLCGALLMGCESLVDSKSEDSTLDGQSAFISTEIDQMGQSLQNLPGGTLAKSSGQSADTITGEKIVQKYAYQEECTCFIRTAQYSDSRGYERDRVDSVTLLDADGQTMDHWDRPLIAKIIHKRHVTRNKGSHDMDVHFNTEATFKTDSSTLVGVWNGTMTGSFDGEDFKSATIDQVTREFSNGKFGFPTSGTVTITRPLRIYSIEFLGGGDAKATITNRRNSKVTVITIDRNYQEKPSV